ncbi:radical SAM family heme chaperone HemW [Aquiluna sp. KACHI24]|uniref:radical SAM family heme chaperone HemW n=1 Tax=Aquiluna sp. KACHI24 TaxID=2968831 RepID=UPI0021FF386A|nr:radical SAM family heme chaperone HemW [Aquiluna sp. KACHI24]BDQ00407.1 coproporphyrinogen III oxidase [Aquiluna sp. KACHI24]
MGALPEGNPWPESNRLATLREPDSFHAYVHIPFCEVRCGYCDFNTYTASELGEVSRSDFDSALISEIEFAANVLSESEIVPRQLSSVFFGGGTPSLMAGEQIHRILNQLSSKFGLAKDAEITLEANPESTSLELLEQLVSAGVNRISFGAQSFDPEVLSVLDRTHRPELLSPLVSYAKDLGLRTSIDLIYGAPGESIESWTATLDAAIALGTEHISAYSLIVEEGTKLATKIRRGLLADVDEDLNAQKHSLADQMFEAAGLRWYEVSNWGNPSVHNQAYWSSKNWWGFGPGAHSHINGNRFWNRKHPAAYQQALKTGSPAIGHEQIDELTHLTESIMLQLRTSEGLDRSVLSRAEVSASVVAKYLAEGKLTMEHNRIYVTKKGRLLVDGIALDLVSSIKA